MRIWVTGVGVVSPLARGAAATMDRLVAGDRAFGKLSLFELSGCRSDIAAEVQGLNPADIAPRGEAESWSRTDAMAVLSAREALAQAGIDPASMPIDLAVGGTTAGMFETEHLLAQISRDPSALAPLQQMLSHPLSSTADHMRTAIGPFRRVRSVCSACSSGANAILLAAAWLRSGASRCVIAGGADGLCRVTYTGFGALAALSPEPCRPFDRRRNGLNLGEGAAFLVLEPEASARARGATPIAELRGWAIGGEAHHITNPEAEGHTAARILRDAIRRAGLSPSDIDYVNAHGTATPLNDSMESAALRECFGTEIDRVRVSSSKGQIGHTLGAAGAIEAAITAMAVQRGVLPPTIGLEEVDPRCELAHVRKAEHVPVRAALSSSFGFGGTDTVLVFCRPGELAEPESTRLRSVVVTGGGTVGPLGVHASRGAFGYLEPGPPPAEGAVDFNAAEHLDLARARRLDRAGRLATIAASTALREAGMAGPDSANATSLGAIIGTSFGSVDSCSAYMRRIYEKGAKYASPADFPNLVPSSPVGHASIYLGLRGAVFAMSDLGSTAETAMVTAVELIHAGEADALVAGSVEEASKLVELVVGPVCSGLENRGVRSEGASVLLFEAADRAAARGAAVVAEVVWWTSWRGDGALVIAEAPPPPTSGAFAVIAREDDRLLKFLEHSAWKTSPRRAVAPRTGDHEGAGGFAAAAAVAALQSGALVSALVVGGAPDRGYAMLLRSPSSPGGASHGAGS